MLGAPRLQVFEKGRPISTSLSGKGCVHGRANRHLWEWNLGRKLGCRRREYSDCLTAVVTLVTAAGIVVPTSKLRYNQCDWLSSRNFSSRDMQSFTLKQIQSCKHGVHSSRPHEVENKIKPLTCLGWSVTTPPASGAMIARGNGDPSVCWGARRTQVTRE